MNFEESTSPTSSDELNVTNPFDSPEMRRLSNRVCSPEVFDITNKNTKNEEFEWSIHELAILKPVDISTESFQENTSFDSDKEPEIQERISCFFRQNTLIRSPASKEAKEHTIDLRLKCQIQDRNDQRDKFDESDQEEQFLPKEVYEKELFWFEYCTPSTPNCQQTPVDSPLQLSPVKSLKVKGPMSTPNMNVHDGREKKREEKENDNVHDEHQPKKLKKSLKSRAKTFFKRLF